LSGKKWGESFLKSGLPLEHIAAITFKSLGFQNWAHVTFKRKNREGQDATFEIDLLAERMKISRNTMLSFLVKCKYHDEVRFWFFHPLDLEQCRWYFDSRVFNCGPFPTIETKFRRGSVSNTVLKTAPLSYWGVVVEKDGSSQDNMINKAVQQLVHGYLPVCLDRLFSYNIDYNNSYLDERDFIPHNEAMIPMIITNAKIFRMKPSVLQIDKIRNAGSPQEIADEVGWTWCYYDEYIKELDQNYDLIEKHADKEAHLVYRYPGVRKYMDDFVDRPNWIVVANINALASAVKSIKSYFYKLKTQTTKSFLVSNKKGTRRKA